MNENFLAPDGEIPDFDFIHESPIAGVAGSHLLNITKEREIFLRAALQLLDHREHQSVPKKHQSKHNISNSNEEDMADVIRCGSLRKLHRNSSVSITWKKKFAELRHGLFSYENESKKWFSKSGRTRKRKKKAIVLSSEFCKCRPVVWKGIYSQCVFEIITTGGESWSRRLWLASSTEERDAWISALNCATVGSAGDFIGITSPDGSALSTTQHMSNQKNSNSLFSHLPGATVGHTDEEESGEDSGPLSAALRHVQMKKGPLFGTPLTPERLYSRSPDHSANVMEVVSGPNAISSLPVTARFAQNISKYKEIQQSVANCQQPEEYQSLLMNLIEQAKTSQVQEGFGVAMNATDKPHILVVPIEFVKKQSQGSCFMRSPTDGLSSTDHTALKSVTSSQVWKDLQRDSIRINGQLISGESQGPEGMLGALVRHILAKVDDIREILQKHDRPLGHVSNEHLFQEKGKKRASVFNNRTSGCAGVGSQHFAIDESQVLACARDMLVLCNRTQSGGDTYFCVDSLICNREYAIVTPSVMESEPLEITVDIMEGNSSNQTHPHTHLSIDLGHMSVTNNDEEVCAGENKDHDAAGGSLPFPNLDDAVDTDMDVGGGGKGSVLGVIHEEVDEDNVDVKEEVEANAEQVATDPLDSKGISSVATTSDTNALTSGEESCGERCSTSSSNRGSNFSDKGRASHLQTRTPSKGSEVSYNGGNMCIRVQIKAKSNYRLCNLDPQDETTDTWATIEGQFEQAFYIKTSCNGRPAISDRLVTVSMQLPNHMAEHG